jgi:hypothetical protein
MAYMNQEKKAKISAQLKPILKKYNIKGSLSVRNHSTIVLTLKSGKIDFIENFIETDCKKYNAKVMSAEQIAYIRKNKNLDVNPYWFQEHFTGTAKGFLIETFNALKSANWYDKTDAQIDYFDTAYYCDVNIGSWNKPYTVTA